MTIMKGALLSVCRCIAGLALAWIAQGCSSDSKAAGTVGASCSVDANCHAGLSCLSQICVSAAAAGGGSGGGGGGGNSGGSNSGGSSAGGGVGLGCTASNTVLAPTSGLIADFAEADGGIEIMGGLFEYGGGSANVGAPTASIDSGMLHITQNADTTESPQYVGVFMYFLQCVDASAFSGAKFSIRGSFSGCSMQVFATDSGHFDVASGADFASGAPGSYQPQYPLDPSQVSSDPQTLMVPFTSQVGGSPATPLDAATLIGMDWQFTIAAAAAGSGTPPCVADLTIDDLTFF